jgi:TIGR03009 family protein
MVQRTLVAVLGFAALVGGASEARPQAQGRPPAGQRPPVRVAQAQQPRPAPIQPQAPPAQAPFQLTAQQQADLDQLLLDWQESGKKVKTFKCTFSLFQYDNQFGPKQRTKGNPNGAWREGEGQLKYAKPDRGMFQVESIKSWDGQKSDWTEPENGEHWVCDGKSLYELDPRQKQVRVRELPPHLQKQGIVSGPLPFLFGADAAQLKQRFWMRITTRKEVADTQIWIQAYPRWAQDAANYQWAELILSRGELQPIALRVMQLNGSPWTYQFKSIKINDPFAGLLRDFAAPSKPFGWTWVEIPVGQNGPGGSPAQAQRPGPAQGAKR